MADTNPIILSFQTEGLEKSNAELKATATNINAIGTATNDVTKDIVDLTNAVKTSKEQLATMKPNTKEFKELSDEIKAAEVSIKGLVNTQESLRAEFANVKKDIGQVNAIMKEMEKQGLTNTQTYKGLASQMDVLKKKGGELKDSIGDMNQEFKTIGSDTRGIDTVLDGVQGITAGFQIAQGASALFGGENKKLEETLVKLNATMSIAQGLQQVQQLLQKETAIGTAIMTARQAAYNFVVGTSTGLLKVLRIALASTGVGALVLGLGLLIANFDEVKNTLTRLFPSLEKIGEFFKGMFQNFTDFIGVTSDTTRAMDKMTDAADKSLAKNKKFMEEHGDEIDEFTKKKIEAVNRYNEAIKKDGANLVELNKKVNREIAAIDKERADEAEKNRKAEADKALKIEQEKNAKILAERKAYLEKSKTFELQTLDEIDKYKRQQKEEEDEWEKRRKEAELERKRKAGELEKKDVSGLERDLEKIRDDATQKSIQRERNIADAKKLGLTTLQDTVNLIFEQNAQNRQDELSQDLANLDERRNQELSQEELTKREIAQINKKYDAEERAIKLRSWKAEKEAKQGQAVINGALAVTNIMATLPPPAWLVAIPAAIAATIIQVAKIAATKPPKFAEGGSVAKKLGYIEGKPHSAGGELIEVEGNEYVMKGKAVNKYGVDFLDSINNLQMETMPKSSSDKKPMIDYNKLGSVIGEKLNENPRISISIDKKGFKTSKGGTQIMNNYVSL